MFKKNFSLIILFIFLCSIPNIIFAVENYNPKDVEVINRILLENDNTNKKLANQGWKINKPETWQRYGKDIDLKWKNGNLIEINFSHKELTGSLDLTGSEYLVYLNLDSNYNIQHLKGLNNKLEVLYLNYIRLLDISPLKDLINLKTLYLSNSKLTDISPLQYLTNLIFLDLNENNISDISALKNLVNLNYLHLSDNNIIDISPLKDLTNLGNLNLSETNINDISALKNLVNLNRLNLSDNNITDVSPLKDLEKLNYLTIKNSNITDFTPLENLTNLEINEEFIVH